jgi:hypothetical protein
MPKRALSAFLAACLALSAIACASAPVSRARPEPSATPAPQASPEAELAPVAWTDEAKAAFEAEVPAMVKKIARKTMEKKARERGIALIDMAFYLEMKKEQMGD